MSSLHITCIQPNLIWEDKSANIRMLESKIAAIGKETAVVILPEMFTTGFSMNAAALAEKMDGETITWMKKVSKEKNIILTGSIIIEENNRFFNRLIWMMPNGAFGHYDKRHLFAYADENKYYTPGNKRLIASVNGWRLNLQICYDLRFPVWARQTKKIEEENRAEYDVLVYVANWPEKRSHAWKTLLTARAIENQSYVIGVNRVGKDGKNINHSGDSMLIDPLGEVLCHKENDEAVFSVTLQKEKLDEIRSGFPFLKDGDRFDILP